MADHLSRIGKNIFNHDVTVKKGNVSGSATSTGSFGKLFIGNQSLTNLGNQVEFSQNIRLKYGFEF